MMKPSLILRVSLGLALALSALAVPSGGAGARSSPSDQLPGMQQPCGAGFAYAVIGGVPTCFHRGFACAKRDNPQYYASGFYCHRGKLAERHPFPQRADLSLTNVNSPNPVSVGADLTYSLTVGNHGRGRAVGVYLYDSLGLLGYSVDYVSSTASQGTCSQVEGSVYCQLGTILSGEAVRVTIVVRLLPYTPCVKGNWGFVESARLDPNFRNNIAWIFTRVTQPCL
jgi:hypothetical protein